MLRINGRSGPLILHPLFSALDKLDFGDGKVARPFVSLDRFGAIHYAAGWGKVSMWPNRPVSPLCTAAKRDQLSHTHTVHCKLRTAPPPPNHLTAQYHLCAHTPPTHTRILICRGRGGRRTLPAPSLEKPGSKTPQRHFEDVYQPVLSLSSSSFSSSSSPHSPTRSSSAFMVLILPHTMQATRASTTISVYTDSSIPAGLRIGPVPGIFKLGKYLSDRKEAGPKKKVSLQQFFI